MSFSYKDESDRCYGATGMAIGLVVFDGEDLLSAIDIDNDAHRLLEMADDFFFAGNPSLSAKSAWDKMVRSFTLTSAMTISNVMCRHIIKEGGQIQNHVKRTLHDVIVDEGCDVCSLEEDEVERIFNKEFSYLLQIFNHQGVQTVAHDFASALAARRRLTRGDVIDHLRSLSML